MNKLFPLYRACQPWGNRISSVVILARHCEPPQAAKQSPRAGNETGALHRMCCFGASRLAMTIQAIPVQMRLLQMAKSLSGSMPNRFKPAFQMRLPGCPALLDLNGVLLIFV